VVKLRADDGGTWLKRLNGAPTEVYGMDVNDSLHAWGVGTFGETQYTVWSVGVLSVPRSERSAPGSR
jgi:hypothetical protein